MNDREKINQCIDGFYIQPQKTITKNDIITMCELLNQHDFYKDICSFEPEPISEGGIVFKFINNPYDYYKSMRIYFSKTYGYNDGEWYSINKDVMNEWKNNDDIIAKKSKRKQIRTFLKSFRNAPIFTKEELKIWENCFEKIGFKRVSKYPYNKYLKK